MIKADHPSLLEPGVHSLSLSDLRNLAASTNHSHRRQHLQQRLEDFLSAFCRLIPEIEIFLDGSFLTSKEEPDDIDMVLFIRPDLISKLSPPDYQELERITQRDVARTTYGLDLYVEPMGNRDRKFYWRGVFGVCHDEVTAKGFAWIKIEP